MTPEQYRYAVDASIKLPGVDGPLWNQAFIVSLDRHGLKLQPCVGREPPPEPHQVQAPWPYSEGLPIWPPAWIIPK